MQICRAGLERRRKDDGVDVLRSSELASDQVNMIA